jgi:hypothetical protein
LLNLLNRFDGGIGTNMRKAAHPSGGMDSSNPHRWRGEQLHHHGDGFVCCLCFFVPSCLIVITRRM